MAERRPKLSVIVDSQEVAHGHAWKFPPQSSSIIVKPLLKYGCDYTVHGYTGLIGVERKSWGDWIGSIQGKHWLVFRKSLDKLRKHRFSCIIVEGTIGDYSHFSNIKTQFVLYRTAQIVTGGVPILYAKTSANAQALCWEFFHHSIKRLDRESNRRATVTRY